MNPPNVRPDVSGPFDLELRSRTLGFPPPPSLVRLSFYKKRSYWLLVAKSPSSTHADVAAWLQDLGAGRMESSASEVRSHWARLRAEWASLLQYVDVRELELRPDGSARLAGRAPSSAIAELQRADHEARPFVVDEFAPIERPRLTPRQRFVLHSCVEWGYYEVPRRITLEGVAKRLGIGVNTISVVLRNAEAAIMRNFAEFDHKPEADGGRRRGADGGPRTK